MSDKLYVLMLTTLQEKLAERRRQAEERDAERRAKKLGLPYLDLISTRVPTQLKAMELVREEEAKEALLVPLQLVRKKLVVAAFDPALPKTKVVLDRLRETHEVEMLVVSLSGLKHGWSYYQYVVEGGREISGTLEINEERLGEIRGAVHALRDFTAMLKGFKGMFTSQVLEIVLGGGAALEASDIHLEPTQSAGVLRVRLDGLLHTVYTEFKQITYRSLVTRIKLLSGLKINVADTPQDGRFTIHLGERDVEIRTSVIPSEYGETVVLRVLDPRAIKNELGELGWRPDDLAIVQRELKRPNGMILNTGPTGSGKTTTLYAFLRTVHTSEMKTITIEDPIEYHLPGISQTQTDPQANYTFASGLRSILRQDPDVILVGEIRDNETAEIAVNASLTGHLVFSTLHTNDAAGTVPRLFDLGVKAQVMGPALALVIAQRLVRLLCPACKTKTPPDEATQKKIEALIAGLPPRVAREPYRTITLFAPKGCAQCRGLGYKGRTAIFELFAVSDAVQALIYANPTEIELKALVRKEGMVSMQEDGILKAIIGLTSFEEVERATGPIVWGAGS